MKRFLAILLLFGILGAGFLHFLRPQTFDIVKFLEHNILKRGDKSLPVAQRESVKYVTPLQVPDTLRNAAMPKWFGQQAHARWLQLRHQIGGPGGEIRFRKAIALAYDRHGNLFVLDFGNKSVEMFDSAGQHVRTFGIGENRTRYLSKPTDLALAASGELLVSDSWKGVLVFSATGRLLRILRTEYEIAQLAFDAHGSLLALTPANDYLLHKFRTDGSEIMAFARQHEQDPALRKAFGQGLLACAADGSVYVSSVSPYRITYFTDAGQPLRVFNRELDTPMNPATIVRDSKGDVKTVIRQQVTFDLAVSADGLIYNLVRTSGRVGGNILDVFSAEGTFLQSFYLENPAIAISLWRRELALLSFSGKQQVLAVYEITEVD